MSMDAEKQAVEVDEDFKYLHAAYWLSKANPPILLPDGQRYTFKNHEYLYEILYTPTEKSKDTQPQIEVNIKSSQNGLSMAYTYWCFHRGIYGVLKNIGYVMPSDPEVQLFAKTKFNPLIQLNKGTIGQYVQSGTKGGSDSSELKKIGNSFLFFKSASSNKMIQGEATSSAATSFPADALIFDERDMMNQDIVDKYEGRVGHSEYKILISISNPTAENFGVDAMFQQSDQRYWNRLCPSCLKYTSPDLEFERGLQDKIILCDNEGLGYIACKHCGKPVPIYWRDGKTKKESRWIPEYPGRRIVGRRFSHLMSPLYFDPYKLLQKYYLAQQGEGSLKECLRNDFGRAYTAKEDQLRPEDVRACCGPDGMAYSHPGPCVMGIDVMNQLNYVAGYRTGKDTYQIIKIGTLSKFSEAYDIAKKFNVKTCGIDAYPDHHAAKTFQASLKAIGCKAFLVDYRISRHIGAVGLDEKNMIIKANRTEAMDLTHNMVMNKQFLFPRAEQCAEFIKQMCNPAKVEIKNAKTGLPEFIYQGKQDHYRHALNYMVLAAQIGKVAIVKPFGFEQKTGDCISTYKLFS